MDRQAVTMASLPGIVTVDNPRRSKRVAALALNNNAKRLCPNSESFSLPSFCLDVGI